MDRRTEYLIIALAFVWLLAGGIFGYSFGVSRTLRIYTAIPDRLSAILSTKNRTETAPSTAVSDEIRLPKFAPVAVMVDNNPSAWPQSGISRADFVYEALVEGGMTRLMGVYMSDMPETVGPVRSARTYFVDWARGLGAIYAHAGGSPDGIAALVKNPGGLLNADEFANGSYFHRSADRKAPHNLYTSVQNLLDLAKKKGWDTKPRELSLGEKNPKPDSFEPVNSVTFKFSPIGVAMKFSYDSKTHTYARLIKNVPSIDRETNLPLAPRNVVFLEVPQFSVANPNAKDALGMTTVGSGPTLVLSNGTGYAGTWKKTSGTSPVELFDTAGKPLALASGQTWFAVLSPDQMKALTKE